MRFEKTLDRFRLLSGLGDSEAVKWLPVIKDSIDYVGSLVTKPELSERDRERLDNAAGAYAFYKYIIYSVELESRAGLGSVSIQRNSDKVFEAEKMWETELREIHDLTGDSDFVFRRAQTWK